MPNTDADREAMARAKRLRHGAEAPEGAIESCDVDNLLRRRLASEMCGQGPPYLAIVWHSRTGAARAMASAAHEGAGDAAILVSAGEVTVDELLGAAGYLFVCPENLGGMTGMMKEMFDRCYYPLLGRIEGRAYATAISAGSDGQSAQAQINRIVMGWRLKRVAEPLIVNLAAQTPEAIIAVKTVPSDQLTLCRDLGAALATGLTLGVF